MNMSVLKSRLVAPSIGRAISSLPSFPQVGSAFAVLVGCVVLVGWTLGLDVLKSGLPGLVAMNPATALCFVASGLSLQLLDSGLVDRRAHGVGLALALGVAAVELIKLLGILTGWNLGVDQVLFHDSLAPIGHQVANRMAPNTATAFLCISLSLACLYLEPRLDHRLSQLFSLCAIVIASLAVIGYIYGVPALSGISSYIHMALNTAVAFVVPTVGVLLARSHSGIMAVFTSDGPGEPWPAPSCRSPLWFRLSSAGSGSKARSFGSTIRTRESLWPRCILSTSRFCSSGSVLVPSIGSKQSGKGTS